MEIRAEEISIEIERSGSIEEERKITGNYFGKSVFIHKCVGGRMERQMRNKLGDYRKTITRIG